MKKLFMILIMLGTCVMCFAGEGSGVMTLNDSDFWKCIFAGVIVCAQYLLYLLIYLGICGAIIKVAGGFGAVFVGVMTFLLMLFGAMCKF